MSNPYMFMLTSGKDEATQEVLKDWKWDLSEIKDQIDQIAAHVYSSVDEEDFENKLEAD